MAISEFEIKKWEKEMEAFMKVRRPPAPIRHELDLGYRIKNQSVEIFEVRPDYQDASKTIERPVAKATFVKSRKCWKIFWQRSDLKWHRYGPVPQVKAFTEFLNVVAKDEYACFFG